MIYRKNYSKEEIVKMVKSGDLNYAGTTSTKIYGEIRGISKETGKKCGGATALITGAAKNPQSSKQVFFTDEVEALKSGFRPCKICLPSLAASWEEANDKEEWKNNRLKELGA